jgi:hypothetical protein
MVRAATAPDSTVDAAIAAATRRVATAWLRGGLCRPPANTGREGC